MRRRGFTLVEVLVALFVMALMAALAWRGIDAMLRARDISQSALERSERLQTVMAQWQQDLEQLQRSGLVPTLQFDGRHLRLVRRHPQGLQVVVWFVADGSLQRWAAPPVTRLGELRRAAERAEQPLSLAGGALLALPGVSGWQLAYYWDNTWANAQSSGNLENLIGPGRKDQPVGPSNPASGAGSPNDVSELPQGLRMTLEFIPDQGWSGPLVRQIQLPTQ